VKALRISFS